MGKLQSQKTCCIDCFTLKVDLTVGLLYGVLPQNLLTLLSLGENGKVSV